MHKNNQPIVILLAVTVILLMVVIGIVVLKDGNSGRKESKDVDALVTEKIPEILPLSASVSSTLPNSSGFSYTAEKSFDGIETTWWSPEGDFYGQWILFDLGQPRRLSGIKILNGAHKLNFSNGGVYYGDLYFQNAILTNAILEFSDATKTNINLKVFDGMQTIEFPEVVTSSVKLICTGVVPGKLWQDVCIAEFRALGANIER